MQKVLWALSLFIFFLFVEACKKTETSLTSSTQVIPASNITPAVNRPVVLPVNILESFFAINKIISWYPITRAMRCLFDVNASKYWGLEGDFGMVESPYKSVSLCVHKTSLERLYRLIKAPESLLRRHFIDAHILFL